MTRGVVVLLVSIAAWLVSLGMVSAKPRSDAVLPHDARDGAPTHPATLDPR
jgi:hypothetical protein